jgi:hypothetical protein
MAVVLAVVYFQLRFEKKSRVDPKNAIRQVGAPKRPDE